jgi:bla regulator protein BlaR1
MLRNTFTAVLNMSITASVAAVLIIFFRWIFGNRLPKIFNYALWAIVLVRLIISFSLPAMFSIFNAIPIPVTIMSQSQQYHGMSNNIPYSTDYGSILQESTASDALNNINDSFPPVTPEASADPMQIIIFFISWIWFAGAAGLFSLSIFAYFRVSRRLKEAVLYKHKDLISQCSQKLKLNRQVQIYTSDRVHTRLCAV